MILALDIGNTNIVAAVYNGEQQMGIWRFASDAELPHDGYQRLLANTLGDAATAIDGAIIASVVPILTPLLLDATKKLLECTPMLVGGSDLDLGIKINIDQPEQAGSDRLVNAVGARKSHILPAIILDFGTATTLDLIGVDGTYEGGIIAPGVNLSVDALEQAAAQLPPIKVRPWPDDLPILGKNTVAAMESGVFWGYVGMVEGLLTRLRDEYGRSLPAIATGGLASLFAAHVPSITMVDPDLTVKGLVEIYARNRRNW